LFLYNKFAQESKQLKVTKRRALMNKEKGSEDGTAPDSSIPGSCIMRIGRVAGKKEILL
jgi:hypothetical protein